MGNGYLSVGVFGPSRALGRLGQATKRLASPGLAKANDIINQKILAG